MHDRTESIFLVSPMLFLVVRMCLWRVGMSNNLRNLTEVVQKPPPLPPGLNVDRHRDEEGFKKQKKIVTPTTLRPGGRGGAFITKIFGKTSVKFRSVRMDKSTYL